MERHPPKHFSYMTLYKQWFLILLSNQLANWHPRLGLTGDSRTTDFQLGLLVLVGIQMTNISKTIVYLDLAQDNLCIAALQAFMSKLVQTKL